MWQCRFCCTGSIVENRLHLKCDATLWRTGGEVKGKLENAVGIASTLHTTSEHGVSSITNADAHTSAASSRLNCPPPSPGRLKWTRPFSWKTKYGFCACAITFQLDSTFFIISNVNTASVCRVYCFICIRFMKAHRAKWNILHAFR